MTPAWPDNPAIGRPMTIGGVRLRTNLLLAPVAKYCDLSWRLTCREQGGVGLACTDLLSPHGLLRGTAHSLDLVMTVEQDRPLCMQLYGGDGEILTEGAVWAVRHGAAVIDINMGCPVDKVTKKDGGSKMLCDPARTIAIAANVAREVERASRGRVPVTAKMRLGWKRGALVAPDLATALTRVGIAAITVHGRTADQYFKGAVDLTGIRAVVDAVHAATPGVPVIGNGDITTPDAALRMFRETGCDGVMIGRGSFSEPWIFRRCWEAQRPDGSGTPEPTEERRVAIIRRYFDLMLRFRDERYALANIQRRISWLGKSLDPCKPLKELVRTAPDAATVHRALDEFLAGGLRGSDHMLETAAAGS